MATMRWRSMEKGEVQLLDGELLGRVRLNRDYMLSLTEEGLMQNFLFEAGLRTDAHIDEHLHGGWESPTCQLRGHFLGHYLSACAHAWRNFGDSALRGRGESLVHKLAQCQSEHGDGWVFSIPETYLDWLKKKKRVWAPQYTIHKTLMGLNDMALLCECKEALDILKRAADWFYDWSGRFTRDEFSDMMNVETGGMMEAWADLYAMTGDEKHLTLMRRYERPRLYEALLAEKDPLTGMHANTTIPEMHGVLRAYEVTGEERYLNILRAYWKCAVVDRGAFATGGQTYDELWTPMQKQREYLGPDNQEHCTVYNLVRLADFLFRQTGEIEYADYMERNLQNGILAQQHPETGMVAYYLPMHSGAKAQWGRKTEDFWCCHGTLVQVHAMHGEKLCYETDTELCITQYRAQRVAHEVTGAVVTLLEPWRSHYAIAPNPPQTPPDSAVWRLTVERGEKPLAISLRAPWWLKGEATLTGEGLSLSASAGQWLKIEDAGGEYTLSLPYGLSCVSLPDDESTVAFMRGPDVLAGLTSRNTLFFDGAPRDAHTLLRRLSRSPVSCREDFYELTGQGESVRFIPLYALADETYTLYFTVKPGKEGNL